jgi:hypothetical protein
MPAILALFVPPPTKPNEMLQPGAIKLECKIYAQNYKLNRQVRTELKIQTIETSASASWLNLLSVSITFICGGEY